MKVQIKNESIREVEFEFPSFYESVWYGDSHVFYAMYSPEKCVTLFWDGSYSQNKADSVIPTLERYEAIPISREQFREALTKSCNSIIQQTYWHANHLHPINHLLYDLLNWFILRV